MGMPQFDDEVESFEDQIRELLANNEIEQLQKELAEKQTETITLQPRKRTVRFLMWNIRAIKKLCKID
jgi:hypothetical protein